MMKLQQRDHSSFCHLSFLKLRRSDFVIPSNPHFVFEQASLAAARWLKGVF